MVVHRPTYATRRAVMSATDIENITSYAPQIDSALEHAADSIDGMCHRRFYNVLETQYWDWPNFQRAYPWRIWFGERELADVTSSVPVVTSGGQTIPSSAIFWGPWNYSPPFTFMELDRSKSYSYGVGPTPQRDVAVTGLFGYWNKTTPAGALAAAVSSTTSTSITVTNGVLVGVGDVVVIDSERMLLQDVATTSTGVSFTGLMDASSSDNVLAVADGTLFAPGEVITLDAERMLITSISSNNLVVRRSYDDTVLASHSSGTIYADRLFTVTRGDFGSTAATHTNAASIVSAVVPGSIRELAIAEALNSVFQKTSGYARSIGENGATPVPGGSLPDLRNDVFRAYGRKSRQAVI